MVLTTRQRKVVESDAQNILCVATPGSGKTTTLTERIRYLITERKVPASQIVAVTFTTMAAEEMRGRLGSIADNAFIGTVHSYANQICKMNGINTDREIADENFNEIIKKAIKLTRDKFPQVTYVFVDEAQDLSQLAYDFVEYLPATHHFFCGDDRQMIYGFNGCTDEYMRKMYFNPLYTVYSLVEDFRNPPNIIDFANSFLRSYQALSPSAVPMKQENGIVEECTFNEALIELENTGNWGSWFILCRTNHEVADILEMLEEKNIPCISFKKGDLESKEDLDILLASNRVKVLTIHTSKGLEAPNVIVTGAKTHILEERKISYVAATRAEDTLYWCPSFRRNRWRKENINKITMAGAVQDRLNKERTGMVTF